MIATLRGYFASQPDILFAWLFGSVATGRDNDRSDVDIAVYVSNRDRLVDADWYLGLKVDLMDITHKEVDLVLLNTATPLIRHAAGLHKVKLCSRDPVFEAEYSLRVLRQYNDVRYWAQRSRQHLLGVKTHGQT